MLIGQQVAKVGPKNRIAVPAKFRGELGRNLIVSYGFENCLTLMSKKGFKNMVAQALSGPITEKKVREEARFLLSGAEEILLDNFGRFVIPTHLKEFAKIWHKVYFVGLARWVEIWDKNLWEKRQKRREKLA